jgi:hypothetical protein
MKVHTKADDKHTYKLYVFNTVHMSPSISMTTTRSFDVTSDAKLVLIALCSVHYAQKWITTYSPHCEECRLLGCGAV